MALGLLLLVAAQVAPVPATNFGGFDEWMVFELNRRGVVAVPYCHRPFNWIWSWPAAALVDTSFAPFSWLFAVYVGLTAALALWLVRRWFPGQRLLALLTAVFSVAWAPGDLARLSTIDRVLYAGETFGILLALALLTHGMLERRTRCWALGAVVAVVTALSYEGTLPLLAGAPLLFLLVDRSRWRAVLAWESLMLGCAAWFAWQIGQADAYQIAVLAPTRDPRVWATRILWQYAYHLGPLFLVQLRELAAGSVVVSLMALAAVLAPERRGEVGQRAALGRAALVGLGLAGLGYALIALAVAETTAFRMQILSGPGMALALAALVGLVASLVPARARPSLLALLSAWVVAVGAGRTRAMQRTWDEGSFGPRQGRFLSGLAEAVPDVAPGTLLVLLDDGGAWRATYGFHHAVQYLYARRASGFVPGAWSALTPARFEADGVRFEPWPVNQRAWDLPAVGFPYASVVVVRHLGDGTVERLDAWPEALPPLPPGAVYAPAARLAAGPLAARALVSRLAEVPAYTHR